jgi:LacI family transcriptional regulator
MLITASTNPFYSELVRGVERSCFERGYSLVLCNTEGDEQRMNRNLETLMQKRVDGLLLLCTETTNLSGNYAALSVGSDGHDGLGAVDGDSDLIQDNSARWRYGDPVSDRSRVFTHRLHCRPAG